MARRTQQVAVFIIVAVALVHVAAAEGDDGGGHEGAGHHGVQGWESSGTTIEQK